MATTKKPKKLETGEGTIITTVRLPRHLHKRLSFAAIEEGINASEVIQKALTAYLDRAGFPTEFKRSRPR